MTNTPMLRDAVALSRILGVSPGTIRRWAQEEPDFPSAT